MPRSTFSDDDMRNLPTRKVLSRWQMILDVDQ